MNVGEMNVDEALLYVDALLDQGWSTTLDDAARVLAAEVRRQHGEIERLIAELDSTHD